MWFAKLVIFIAAVAVVGIVILAIHDHRNSNKCSRTRDDAELRRKDYSKDYMNNPVVRDMQDDRRFRGRD